jgi:hypothetical protein
LCIANQMRFPDGIGGGHSVGQVSFDGLTTAFIACDTAGCDGTFFAVGSLSLSPATEVSVSLDGDFVFEELNLQAYSLKRLAPTGVPEPGTPALFGIAGLGLVAAARRRQQLPAPAAA